MTEHHLDVPASAKGERLDRWIADNLADLSRAQVSRLMADGSVLVDGEPPSRTGLKLSGGERLTITIPDAAPTAPQPEAMRLDVLYEDESVLVLNKPAGLVIHPAPGHSGGTLVNALLARYPGMNDAEQPDRPGVVHRLDRDTSGVLIVAKTVEARRALQREFQRRATRKEYLALVLGAPPTPRGTVEGPIGRHPTHRQRRAVVPDGRPATTHYETVAAYDGSTLLRVHPITGRTHQIRVHLEAIGVPVAGDELYGPRRRRVAGLTRHFLHAERLTLTLPDGVEHTFEAPLPAELQTVLDTLERTEDR